MFEVHRTAEMTGVRFGADQYHIPFEAITLE
jgi:hypothetical protein